MKAKFLAGMLGLMSAAVAGGADVPANAYQEAPVVVWNRPIVVFRAPYDQTPPAVRAENATKRILDLPVEGPWDVETHEATVGAYTGAMVTVEGRVLFGVLDQDVDAESGESALDVAIRGSEQVLAFLQARSDQSSPARMVKHTVKASLATVLMAAVMGAIFALRRLLLRRWEERAARRMAAIRVKDVDLSPMIASVRAGAVRLLSWVLVVPVLYVWLGYVLALFPYSRPWGDHLGRFLVASVQRIGSAVVGAVPGLFMVVLVFVITRFVTRLIGGFFLSVEHGLLKSDWLRPDTARASRRIVGALIWAFALTIAYPYIPGSSSAAFKGVSVFLGLMMSLGSAGMINQIISGLVVVYSRAFETGDLVRIGETEGVVKEVGLLSTKILTPKKEEVTVPNALLVSTPTWNFSTFGGGKGAYVSTTVTVGYNAPWRQVHAMLKEAASKTRGICASPEPFVIQKSLADICVEYHLVAQIEEPVKRMPVLSELHGHIQDVFNEHGVQIMTPHYEGQPDEKVLVPKDKWYTPPAEPGGTA